MDILWLLVAAVLLLVLGMAALAFDTARRHASPGLPRLLTDLTTRLMGASVYLPGRGRRRAMAHSAGAPRVDGRLLKPPIALMIAGIILAGAFIVMPGRDAPPPAEGAVVIGLCPFAGAPTTGSPTEAFADHFLEASAADGIINLTLRQSRKTVGTPEEAEAERARMGADALWWGEVGADGTLTVSLTLAPNFTPGQPAWLRLEAGDLQGWAFPQQAQFRLPAATGTDPMVPVSAAIAQLKLGNYAQGAKAGYGAAATLDQAAAQSSPTETSGSGLARILEASGEFAAGRLQEASASLDAAEQGGAFPSEALVDRAIVKRARGDYSGAQADAGQALAGRNAADDVQARAYFVQAGAEADTGQLAAALADLDESIRLDPTLMTAKLARAEVLYRQAQPDAARKQLEELLSKTAYAAPGMRLMGLTLLALGRPQDALQSLGRAEALMQGWLDQLRRDEAKANAMSDAAAAHRATDAILVLNRRLAEMYLYQGMAWADIAGKEPPETFFGGIWRRLRGEPTSWERARDRMLEAKKLDPQRADTWLHLAGVYRQTGDLQSAGEALQEALRFDPNAPEPYLALAELQRAQNNPKEAVATLRQLLERSPATFQAYMDIYDIYNASGDTASAQTALQTALQTVPSTGEDHLWRGKFLHILGRDTEAIEETEQAASDPQLWEAHLLLGRLLQSAGQAPDALVQYQQALAVQPNNPDALLGAGQLLVTAGQVDEAQKLFERLTTIWPDNVEGHIAYTQLLIQRGQLDRAVAEGQRAVQAGGTRADAHFFLGAAYEAKKDWADAAEQFKTATQRDPEQFEAFIRWAHSLYKGDLYKETVEVSNSAIALRDNDPQPYRWKAEAQLALGQPRDALASLATAVQLAPHDPQVLALTARAYTQAGDEAKAATFADLATQADPHGTGGPLALGALALATNKPDEALQAYNAALSVAPGLAEALAGQGRAYAALGDPAKALQSYAAALSADSGFAPAHLYAGHAYTELGQWDEAFKQYQAAVQLRPQWPEALDRLGNAYLQRKDLQNAQAAFAKAVQGAPNLEDAWFGLGLAGRGKGQGEAAIEALKQAVNLDAGYADAWLYLGLTYEETGQQALAAQAFARARDTAQSAAVREQAEQGLSRVK